MLERFLLYFTQLYFGWNKEYSILSKDKEYSILSKGQTSTNTKINDPSNALLTLDWVGLDWIPPIL